MITASELAGFIAAHAIWRLSDADGFAPMLAFTTEDGQRKLERLAGEDVSATVENGKQRLEDDPFGADDGVLAYDGRLTLECGKVDAVVLVMRSYGFPGARATLAVPYSPRSLGQFRVHRPELLEWERCGDFDMDAALEAFFHGVAAHDQGARVWEKALTQSK